MKIKTSELTGTALDWAVAKCEGVKLNEGNTLSNDCDVYSPSTDWEQGGPILERERIEVRYRVGVNMTATIDGQYAQTVAHTERPNPVLIAAMRCFVASKLGDEVDVPDGLEG